MNKDVVPKEFICPITLQLMNDTCLAEDGHSYEREAITRWFNTGETRSPVTNEILQGKRLFPNHALKTLIQTFRTRLGEELLILVKQEEEGKDSLVMELLERGADPNIRGESGKTCLFFLLQQQRFVLALQLVHQFNADPTMMDDTHTTCMDLAKQYNAPEAFLEHLSHACSVVLKQKENKLQRKLKRPQVPTDFFPSLFSLQFQEVSHVFQGMEEATLANPTSLSKLLLAMGSMVLLGLLLL